MPIVKAVYREGEEESKKLLTFADLGLAEIFRLKDGTQVRVKLSATSCEFFPPDGLGPPVLSVLGTMAGVQVVRLDATLSDVHESKEQ